MTKCFMRNDGLYIETITDVTTWPDDRVPVPKRPAPHWDWDGESWVEGVLTVEPAQVNAERDRRLHMQPFTVTGYNATILVEGDAADRQNLLALGTIAQGMIEAGNTEPMQYRDGANVVHALTPAQMHELWMKGAALISAVSRASWVLKDDPNGIPADFAEDSYWPA